MTNTISENITFEEAIQLSQSLLDQIQTLSDSEIGSQIAQLVKSEKGARGFFVTYLTGENPLAEAPTPIIINALKSSPEIVGELLVKNLAMSTATAIAHRNNNNEEMVQGSEIVQKRSLNLIKQLQLGIITHKLQQLRLSLETASGDYQPFLDRWQYDTEQRQQIHQIISEIRD